MPRKQVRVRAEARDEMARACGNVWLTGMMYDDGIRDHNHERTAREWRQVAEQLAILAGLYLRETCNERQAGKFPVDHAIRSAEGRLP
jgi:hypothetical protein